MIRRIIVGVVGAAMLSTCGGSGSMPRIPTLNDLATVWVGEGEGGNEYFGLELRPDGTGVLAVQYLVGDPTFAYRVTGTRIDGYAISFELSPVESDAEPITLRGEALATLLKLEASGLSLDWKRQVHMQPYPRVMRRMAAVTARAQQYLHSGR